LIDKVRYNISVDVIGVGFGRTGTLSLKTALEKLGFGPCAHFVPLLEDPQRADLWRRAAEGEPGCLDAALDGYRSTVDWPGTFFWRDLTTRHPAAKVILTSRDPERWYDSAANTIFRVGSARIDDLGPQRAMANATVWEGTFGGRFADRAAAIKIFEEHNAAVRSEIPPERLLDFQVREGWQPLCDFLGVPVPEEEFPRLNDQAAFAERSSRYAVEAR
jgi:hypothetical protein